jgi:hypothetical protein
LPCFVVAGILFFPYSVLACSGPTTAPDWTPPSIQDRVSEADIVLEGTVTSVTIGSDSEVATLRVSKYYKGQGPVNIKIRGFGPETDCRTPIEVGNQAIFFTYGDPNTVLRVGRWYQSDPDKIASSSRIGYDVVENINPSIISEIIKATGRDPVLPNNITSAATLAPIAQFTPAITPQILTATTSGIVANTNDLNDTESISIESTSKSVNNGLNGWLIVGLILVVAGTVTLRNRLRRKRKR